MNPIYYSISDHGSLEILGFYLSLLISDYSAWKFTCIWSCVWQFALFLVFHGCLRHRHNRSKIVFIKHYLKFSFHRDIRVLLLLFWNYKSVWSYKNKTVNSKQTENPFSFYIARVTLSMFGNEAQGLHIYLLLLL